MSLVSTVYFNQGEIYKQEVLSPTGDAFAVGELGDSHNEYFTLRDPDPNNLYNWIGIKCSPTATKTKRYSSTLQVNSLMGMSGGVEIPTELVTSLVSLWLAVGTYDNSPEEYEAYFYINDPWLLPAIAAHYGLLDPITDDQKTDIVNNPMDWRERILKLENGIPTAIVVGSVAFESNKPVRLKVYKFHHPDPL